MRPTPIGVFDSGIGGLGVVRHLRRQLPHEDILFLADQAHVPYGPRPLDEIIAFSEAICHAFIARRVKSIVVACNTASAALAHLRATFPDTPIVGMEPAVKPGAARTRSGQVGVLATAGTFESERYARLMTRFARDITVHENPCVGLVPLIEAGDVAGSETRALLTAVLQPMLAAGVDTLVLGCTHYPFALPLIAEIAGPGVQIIDPAPAVARQTARVLSTHALLNHSPTPGAIDLHTTGDPAVLERLARDLLGWTFPVYPAYWHEGVLGWGVDSGQ